MTAVLNPGGRDAELLYPAGPGLPDDRRHAPVNFHAYAACTNGGFYRAVERVPSGGSAIVLLRKRNLRPARQAVVDLRGRGVRTFISFKECGTHQIAETLGDVTRLELFREICSLADGAVAPTSGLPALFRAAGCSNVHMLPTPYPVDVPGWDFSVPLEKRRGIFVGTREFSVPSRNHLEAVVLADALSRELEIPLAVVNTEGRRGGMILKSLRKKNPFLFIIEAPMPYTDYLRVMALHRIVWQLDASHVPGQVAGDALLCRMPCLGGNGEIDRVAFGASDATADAALRRARALLQDDREWQLAVDESQERARQFLSFSRGASRLRELEEAALS